MTEYEYADLMDAVQDALAQADDLIWIDASQATLAAANDNDLEWELVPFPEGWHASP